MWNYSGFTLEICLHFQVVREEIRNRVREVEKTSREITQRLAKIHMVKFDLELLIPPNITNLLIQSAILLFSSAKMPTNWPTLSSGSRGFSTTKLGMHSGVWQALFPKYVMVFYQRLPIKGHIKSNLFRVSFTDFHPGSASSSKGLSSIRP